MTREVVIHLESSHPFTPEYPEGVLAVLPRLPPEASGEASVSQRQLGGLKPAVAVHCAQRLLARRDQVLVAAAGRSTRGTISLQNPVTVEMQHASHKTKTVEQSPNAVFQYHQGIMIPTCTVHHQIVPAASTLT